MKKIVSLLMAVVLVLSLVPWAFAAEYQTTSFSIVSRKTSAIAPGVTQDIVYAKLTSGDQLAYYTATVDMSRDNVGIYTSYKDDQWADWGFSKLTDQLAAAQRVHTDPNSDRYVPYYNVVGGINASFYNMSTGQPNGAFAMEGHIIQDATGTFFAVLADGTPVIGFSKSEWDTLKANTNNPIMEAVGGSRVQVKDGQLVATAASDYNARTSIGLTADGKVVMAVADGKQAPYSRGADMKHMGEILLEAGCVSGIELDGGGSTAYAARQEGDDHISLVDRPCDGSERQISAGLMIVSTTPPSTVFDRARLSAASEYVTPGSTVAVAAAGVSPAGTSAEIPADAIWQVADTSLGSVTQDGVFTSSGAAGDAVVQMVYGDRVVGETTIHVVVPDSLAFAQPAIAVPYGATVDISVKAHYGEHEVTCKAGDITLSLSDAALGTLNGFSFTACAQADSAPTSGIITASLAGTAVTATATISLGRGSKVLFDFESDTAGTMPECFTWAPNSSHVKYNPIASGGEVVTAETGRVHSGSQALALCANWSNICDYGGCLTIQLDYKSSERIDLTGAVRIGAWVWIPDEYAETRIRFVTMKDEENTVTSTSFERLRNIDGGRWVYVSQELNVGYTGAYRDNTGAFLQFELFASDTKDAAVKSACNKVVYYVDDITVDYSEVVPDREAPVFSAVNLRANADSSIPMAKGAVTASDSGTVSFSASVSEDTAKSNYTGLSDSSAEAFLDGQRISVSCQNGVLSTGDVTLAAGVHTLTLGISDNTGNYDSVTRQFRVSANADVPTVKVVAHDPAAANLPVGSVYYVDVVATDVSAIDGVELALDLNNISVWELEHAEVDYCFEMGFQVQTMTQGDNIATLRFTRKSSGEADNRTGEIVLASLPVRTWQGDSMASTDSRAWRWPRDISVEVDYGKITYAAGCGADVFPGFSSARIQVDTELNRWGWTGTPHTHTNGDPQNKEAACTASGYAGRVFCTTCNSPVVWGTATPATGHNWDSNEDGKLACSVCNELFTGEYECKRYVNGVAQDGWAGESYYRGGVKLTGVQNVESIYYNFGENGVCVGKKPYSGFWEQDSERRYAELGVLKTGWFDVGEDRYHSGEDGLLHTVTLKDNRGCVISGKITYTCSCGEVTESETLWFEGHNWDDKHVCTKCGYQGIDIADAKLEIDGKYFEYTGKPILAAHTATYEGRVLTVRGDKTGLDGYVSYYNNVDVGVATLSIRGECNFYGELTGTFEIVPASVSELTAVQRGDDAVVLDWPDAPGADYYWLQQKVGAGEWETISKNVRESAYTVGGAAVGDYTFRVASCAERNGAEYLCTKWSPSAQVGVQPYFQIKIGTTKGGSILPSPLSQALPGETVTITAIPDSGYQVKSVTVRGRNNTAVPVTKVTDTQYTFTMPASAVTISASFNACGQCQYLPGVGPFNAQLELSDLLAGRTYVCQMQKANESGKAVGCAAIVVFTAAGSTHRLEVLSNPSGYIVSLWAYPASGVADSLSQLSNAFYGVHTYAETQQFAVLTRFAAAFNSIAAALDDIGNTFGENNDGAESGWILTEDGEITTGVDETDADDIEDNNADGGDSTDDGGDITDNGEDGTEGGENGIGDENNPGNGGSDVDDVHPQIECRYLAGSGLFNARLELTNLLSGRTYVCQMQKADANGNAVGCAALMVFTAEDSSQMLDVLSNPTGYIVSLWAYPSSGSISSFKELKVVFYNRYIH